MRKYGILVEHVSVVERVEFLGIYIDKPHRAQQRTQLETRSFLPLTKVVELKRKESIFLATTKTMFKSI